MDWDLKMPSWDLPELESEAAERSLGSVVAGPSAAGAGRRSGGPDCSVDLKLGGLGDFGTGNEWQEQPEPSSAAATAPAVPSSGPSSAKRPRSAGNGLQNASCAVDGCKEDLSKGKEYNRRHKVCERHSKTAVVIVSGQQQRFCQQCSRFHLLAEFDEVKRSCRKRLDGHNRRRRKARPDSVNSRSLFSNHQAYPQIFSTDTSQPSWSGIVKTEESPLYAHRADSQLIESNRYFANSHSYSKGRKQFPFLHETPASLSGNATLGSSMCQSHLSAITPPGSSSGSSSSRRMLSEGLTRVFHSDCALSLLSSPMHTSSINLNHLVPSADQIPMAQSLASNYLYGNFTHLQAAKGVSPAVFPCSEMEDEQATTMLVPDANVAEIQCQSIFHVAGEGVDGAAPALPFTWQ